MPHSQLADARVDSSGQTESVTDQSKRLLLYSAAIILAVVFLVLVLFSTSWIQIAIAIIPIIHSCFVCRHVPIIREIYFSGFGACRTDESSGRWRFLPDPFMSEQTAI